MGLVEKAKLAPVAGVVPGGDFFPPAPRGAIESFPIVYAVSPDSDRVSGGAALTITGIRFVPGASVTINGVAATSVVVVSSTSITCNAPAGTEGIVDLVVTNPNGEASTLSSCFTYIAGHIVSLSNGRGLSSGGTNVTITGVNFVTGSTIQFGGVNATGVIFVDSKHFFCVTPAHSAGTVDVTITEPGGAVVTGKKLFSFTSTVFNEDIRRNPSITVRDTLNSGPNTASFTIDGVGVPPVGGEKVIFTDGDTLIFSGQVSTVEQIFEGDDPANLAWNVTATDHRFRFNRKRPFGTWDNTSATLVVRELVAKYAPDFNTDFVQSNLPRISLVLDGSDDLSTILTKIAGLLGEGHWYIDYKKSVHLFALASSLGTSETPVSALELPSRTALTVTESTVSTLGYAFVPGYYYFMSSAYYGVPSTGPTAKVYDSLSGTGVSVMAGRANASGVWLNYGQGGTPSLAVLPGQDSNHPRWIMLSRQAANRNLQGDISNGVYCGERLQPRGWIGVDADGNIFPEGTWPAAGPNVIYFASADVWNALETASGPPAQPQQAAFESALSQISNVIYLEKWLPSFSNIPVGDVVGGRSATSRNIYAVRLGDAHGGGGTTIQGYATLNDNVSTTMTGVAPTTNFTVPPHQKVNPPAGPPGLMTVNESSTAVDTSAFLGRTAQAGYWAFKVTCVYRDGTESKSSAASGPVHMTGINQAQATGIPIGQSINGVDVVFRRVYGSVYNNPVGAQGVPDFESDNTACVAIIPNNTATTLLFPFGSAVSGGEHTPNGVPPGEEDLPGPDLESLIAPEDITDDSQLLLVDPPITPTSDTSQLRNRIFVKGKGTIVAADAAVGDTSVSVADVSTFSPTGGTFIVGSRIVAYNGVDNASTPQKLLLPTGLAQPILQANWLYGGGKPILPIIVVDDLASQKFYGALELDDNGNPTDGIHEYTINDDSLTTIQQMYVRGLAELKLFSRPVVTLKYSTRDPLTKAGKVVHVDLTDPPITGDFIIQEVVIDQFHDESDDLAPRYNVTADSAARFNFNDLILKLSESVGDKASGSSAGVISTAVNMAVESVSGNAEFGVFEITGIADMNSSFTGPGILTNNPGILLGIGNSGTTTPSIKADVSGVWVSVANKLNSGGQQFCQTTSSTCFLTLSREFDILWRIRTPTAKESNFSQFPAGGNPASIYGNQMVAFGIGTGSFLFPINVAQNRFIGFMLNMAKPSGSDSWDPARWNASWVDESASNGKVISAGLNSLVQDVIYLCRLRVVSWTDINVGVVEFSMNGSDGAYNVVQMPIAMKSTRAFQIVGSAEVNVNATPEASMWFSHVECRVNNP